MDRKQWRWLILGTSLNLRDQLVYGKDFPNFRDVGREDCFDSEQDHPRISSSKGRLASRNRKAR